MSSTMFTRRHYEAIARTVAEIDNPRTRAEVCARLARMFKGDNCRFKEGRFERACNANENGRAKQ